MPESISIPLTDGENYYTVLFSKDGAQVLKNTKSAAKVNWESIAALIVDNCVYDKPY